ncbi:MAG: AAA family ATPase [Chloroflexi bacterium]|nr:AAA family ATPase [Chloroflexota bacterium]MDA1239412.1 AAA family ATPase [Chloroflexota bacterium]
MSKLVIIRGPSGAGKSTIAEALMERVTRLTALVARDRYMFMFRPDADLDVPDKDLIEHNILHCLGQGIDVVFEGNFKPETHRELLNRLFSEHPHENYVFYLDVSLDETLRRHDQRAERLITTARMRELYDAAVPLGHPDEVVIREGTSLEDAVRLIRTTAGI